MMRRAKCLMLGNMNAAYIPTITDHLEAFAEHSQHEWEYCHITGHAPPDPRVNEADVLAVHYSARVCVPGHIMEPWMRAIHDFPGIKIAFIQDDYDNTNRAIETLTELAISHLFTAMPLGIAGEIYAPLRARGCTLHHVLTGYVPRRLERPIHARALAGRPYSFVYRAPALPEWYGRKGDQKIAIGHMMRAYCERHKILHDIRIGNLTRVYEGHWQPFLASGRATLATESGASIFDTHGHVKRWILEHPHASKRAIREMLDANGDGRYEYSLPSPKMFEAACLRTVLVMFPGTYQDIFVPGEHFIELMEDGSNIGDVVEQVHDDGAVHRMTERVHRDIVRSGEFSYRGLVELVDRAISGET